MSETVYRPGLEGVIAGETAISTISDKLRYRGYSIEDLARDACFEEVAFLILHGDLPNADQLDGFRKRLATNAPISSEIRKSIRSIPRQTPLMDVLRTGASLLAHWDPESRDISRPAQVRKAERLLAKLPTVLSAFYRLRQSKEPVSPDGSMTFAANLLWMLQRQRPPEEFVRAMDVSLILYAEHELNASTFTARVIASTLSDLHSCITGAIGALKGTLQGGANERVMAVLLDARRSGDADTWVRAALERKERIMGFGHRVYKTGDPRAVFLKPLCRELAVAAANEELENTAETIESIMHAERELLPNVDWPTARLYHYLGFEVDLFTPLFVVSRVVGWSAHVIEQLDANRLIRPRSRYIGVESRMWRPLGDRD